MTNNQTLSRVTYWGLPVVTALVFSVALPYLFTTYWTVFHQVLYGYFLINGLYALYSGYQIRHRKQPWLYTLLFPALFASLTTAKWQLINDEYGYYFSAFYLVVILLLIAKRPAETN